LGVIGKDGTSFCNIENFSMAEGTTWGELWVRETRKEERSKYLYLQQEAMYVFISGLNQPATSMSRLSMGEVPIH